MKLGSVGNFDIRFAWPLYLNLETGWRGKLAPVRHMFQRMRGWWPRKSRIFCEGRERVWYRVGPFRIIEKWGLMNAADILSALHDCESTIKAHSPRATATRASTNMIGCRGETKYQHALWMIEETRGFVSENRIEKAFRWLGFIQGVLWAFDLLTIDQAKEANRPKQ